MFKKLFNSLVSRSKNEELEDFSTFEDIPHVLPASKQQKGLSHEDFEKLLQLGCVSIDFDFDKLVENEMVYVDFKQAEIMDFSGNVIPCSAKLVIRAAVVEVEHAKQTHGKALQHFYERYDAYERSLRKVEEAWLRETKRTNAQELMVHKNFVAKNEEILKKHRDAIVEHFKQKLNNPRHT